MPPLSVRTPPHRPPHVKSCHPERSDRRSRAARDRRFRPRRRGSWLARPALAPCPLLRTDFRISNFAFRCPLATLAPAISPATRCLLLAPHFLNTQDLPQTLSHHALAHNFRDTPGWGVSPTRSPSPLATVPLFSYSYALFCIAGIAISRPFNAFRTLCTKHPGWRRVSMIIMPSEARTSAPPRPPRERSLLLLRQPSTNHPPLSTIPA